MLCSQYSPHQPRVAVALGQAVCDHMLPGKPVNSAVESLSAPMYRSSGGAEGSDSSSVTLVVGSGVLDQVSLILAVHEVPE